MDEPVNSLVGEKTTGLHRSTQKNKSVQLAGPTFSQHFPGEPQLYPTKSHVLWLHYFYFNQCPFWFWIITKNLLYLQYFYPFLYVFIWCHYNPRIESPILCQNVLIWQMQQNISYSATEPRLKLAVNVASILCCCIEVDFNGYCFALWLYFETWQLTKQWGSSLFKVKKIRGSDIHLAWPEASSELPDDTL